ncbi:MAG TPA: hypothetical protein VNT26_21515 [Candidatus Sulfotelmatobacter sp.]|nr:hypothetical protein [Candidatus Sulfotelmatobacter sp.]HWI58380.1 hypothetical protein [Bacillota bacterium]
MRKTFELMSEMVSNAKHAFHKVENHPAKAIKHRYERRKVRKYLTLTDWLLGEAE